MNKAQYPELVLKLKELVSIYRSLYTVVRSEKNALMTANLEALTGLNAAKIKLIAKVKVAEAAWSQVAEEMNSPQAEDNKTPRLVSLALQLEGDQRTYLLRMRKVLNILIERSHNLNKENARLIESALAHVSGAMDAIRQDIAKDSVYQKKGKKQDSNEKMSGRLMSKEV